MPRLSFRLLLALARHAPNVVSTSQLEAEVWEGLVVDRGTVNKRVVLLRKALSDGCDGDEYIAVIRGSGYRLVAPVERVDCGVDDAAFKSLAHHEAAEKRANYMRIASFALIGILALSVLYLGAKMTMPKFRDPEPALPPVMDVQVPAVPAENSIAVLPFVDLTEDQDHQYLGDGVAEEIINALARVPGLEVAARTSSFAFRDTGMTAVEIAPRLRVGKILEGSVRQSGKHIRVTAQLIDVRTGYHIWSQNYDHDLGEVLKVQDDIAANIAQLLRLSLVENSPDSSGQSMTTDFEAFELYLRGKELLNNRIELRAEGLHSALEFFSRAVDKDPGFARAHAGVALAWRLISAYDDSVDFEIYSQRAEASANYALELDPRSVDAMAALASVYTARGEYEKAIVLFKQIREIGTNESYITHWEALLNLRLGYFEVMIEPLNRLYRLDPYNEYIGWSLAAALNFAGDPQRATAILENLEHFAYRQYALGLCALNAGDYARARELLRDVQMRSGVLPARFANLLVDALENSEGMPAAVAAVLGANATGELTDLVAFEALLLAGSPAAFDIAIDPLRDISRKQLHAQVWNNWGTAMRRDTRFKQWVIKLGYGEVWSRHGWPDRCKPTGAGDFECI